MRYHDGQTVSVDGREFLIRIQDDEYYGAPWEMMDTYAPVSDWEKRKKRSDEVVIAECDYGVCRFYSVKDAVEGLRKHGVSGTDAVKYVWAEVKYLRGWVNAEWNYVTVTVEDVESGERESLSGIESFGHDYIAEVIEEHIATLFSHEDAKGK